jgi:hypothetical protein
MPAIPIVVCASAIPSYPWARLGLLGSIKRLSVTQRSPRGGAIAMTLAEIVFQKKKLEEKYGVEGKVAGFYVEAGYDVRMSFNTSKGTLSFVAKKGSQLLAVDVIVASKVLGKEVIEALAEKAKAIKAKPVLILYGAGPKLSDEAKAAAKELSVEVKRVRP